MTIEQIDKFLSQEDANSQTKSIKIDFKKRNSISGLIIKAADFSELKSKNFWRIVTKVHFSEWEKSKNLEFAKIFSGSEFTRLSFVSNKD